MFVAVLLELKRLQQHFQSLFTLNRLPWAVKAKVKEKVKAKDQEQGSKIVMLPSRGHCRGFVVTVKTCREAKMGGSKTSVLLEHDALKSHGADVDDLQKAVAEDAKGRFKLDANRIRAVSGW